jgi:hypothetical protein
VKLQEVLSQIHAPKGVSSIIAGALSGNWEPLQGQDAIGADLTKAEGELARVSKAMNDSQSDWAYWGWAGDVAYWTCVVALLKAAAITGPNNLPDVPLPDFNGVVMDVQAHLEDFGAHVLAKAAASAV